MTDKAPTQNMAIICDFENVALGVEDAEYSAFDIQKVLERLLLKGNVVVKKAYCDWDRYKRFKNWRFGRQNLPRNNTLENWRLSVTMSKP